MAIEYYGKTILTVDQIKRKIRQAKRGDQKVLDELIRVNYLEADRANKRLKTQAKSTPNAYAFKQALHYLRTQNQNSFSKASKKFKLNIDALETQLLALNLYNRSKSGTVKGAREIEFKNRETLEKMGIDFNKIDPEVFEAFLNSDIFKEFKKFDSERAIIEGYDALLSGRTLEDAIEAWDKYQTSKYETMDDAWFKFINDEDPEDLPFD